MMKRKEAKFIADDEKISCRDEIEILSRNRYAQMSTVYLSKRGLRDKYPVNSLRIDMTNY